MRGKVVVSVKLSTSHGITPAYAGKRHDISTIFAACRDHPRLCGEKLHFSYKIIQSQGSPPPMRGKVAGVTGRSGVTWITPAYAGKSAVAKR